MSCDAIEKHNYGLQTSEGNQTSSPEFQPITSSRLLRGENDSKQSDEFQATNKLA